MSDEMTTTNWLADTRVAIESVRDRYCPASGWLSSIQLGLRSDGVLMWRRVDDNDQPVSATATAPDAGRGRAG